MELSLADGRRIRLDQVASISDAVAEQRSLALLNGKPVVGFEVTRSRGASEVEVGASIQKALTELQAANPDIEFTEAFNKVRYWRFWWSGYSCAIGEPLSYPPLPCPCLPFPHFGACMPSDFHLMSSPC